MEVDPELFKLSQEVFRGDERSEVKKAQLIRLLRRARRNPVQLKRKEGNGSRD